MFDSCGEDEADEEEEEYEEEEEDSEEEEEDVCEDPLTPVKQMRVTETYKIETDENSETNQVIKSEESSEDVMEVEDNVYDNVTTFKTSSPAAVRHYQDDDSSDDECQAMKDQMGKLLEDIDNKSSVSDNGDLCPLSDVSDKEEVLELEGDSEQVVLDSVKRMTSSSENMHVDETFITKRGGNRAAVRRKKKPIQRQDSVDSDSSFTISTPSNSGRSSVSSLAEEVQRCEELFGKVEECNDSDDGLIKEYQLTLSQKLDEDCSDENMSPEPPENNLDDTLQGELNRTLCDVSAAEKDISLYETPDASVEDKYVSANSTQSHISPRTLTIKGTDLEVLGIKDVKNSDQNFIQMDGCIGESNVDDLETSSKTISEATSSELSTLTTAKKTNSDGSAWRALPPIPAEENTISKKPSLTRSLGSTGESQKEGGRKLPDISQLKSKAVISAVEQSSFQSKFMREKLGSPSTTLSDSTGSSKEGSSSPEMMKSVNKKTNQIKSKPSSYSSQLSSDNSYVSSSSSKREITTSSSVDKSSKTGGRTKISVNPALLHSNEDSSSQNEEGAVRRKKISVDQKLKSSFDDDKKSIKSKSKSSIGQATSGIDDIPFADDDTGDEQINDVFYTPATSLKPKPAVLKHGEKNHSKDVRKRILPTPPVGVSNPAVPSVTDIKQIRKSERELAREKARLKSDEELGLAKLNYTPVAGHRGHRKAMGQSSTSDFVSDSDDINKPKVLHSTPVINGAELKTPKFTKEKKKKKDKKRDSVIGEVAKAADKSDNECNKSSNKKRKSLLSMLRPNKSSHDKSKESSDRMSSSNDTLDDTKTEKKKKKKTPKSDKKKKKSLAAAEPVTAEKEITEDMNDLKLVPVFSKKDKKTEPERRRIPYKRTLPPRAQCELVW